MFRIIISIVLVAAMLFTAASCGGSSYERALLDAKQLYDQATDIVTARCISSHIDERGRPCADIKITECVAGALAEGDIIHCGGADLQPDTDYLVYLTPDLRLSPVDAENRYVPLKNSPFKLTGENVVWDGMRISLDTIFSGVASYGNVITVPQNVYYYSQLEDIVHVADEIFIGRIHSMPALETLNLRSKSGGAVVENSAEASILSIDVLGVIKGRLSAGDTAEMVYIPSRVFAMVDAVTLEPLSKHSGASLTLSENETYLFFLKQAGDVKQNYYVAVNPVQGWLHIKRDLVTASLYNGPFSGSSTLETVVLEIKSALEQ